MIGMTVTSSGPMFDGRADAAAERACREVEDDVAEEGLEMIRAAGWATYQNPTGRYSSSLGIESSGPGKDITDGGMIYGPWLEGVGSRNKTTRFKGYRLWRQTAQALDAKAGPMAEVTVGKYIKEM